MSVASIRCASRERYRARTIATSLAAFLAAPSAWAESPPGFYLGGGFGWSNVAVESNADNFFPTYLEGEEDSASEFHFGYRIGRHFGAELGYLDTQPEWDNFTYSRRLDEVYHNAVDLDLEAVQLSVVGILPFARVWEGYVRGGVSFWQTDADRTLTRLSGGGVSTTALDRSSSDLLLGVGVGASPTPAWHLRFEFQSFEIDRDLVSVGNPTTVDTWLFLVQFHLGARHRRAGSEG